MPKINALSSSSERSPEMTDLDLVPSMNGIFVGTRAASGVADVDGITAAADVGTGKVAFAVVLLAPIIILGAGRFSKALSLLRILVTLLSRATVRTHSSTISGLLLLSPSLCCGDNTVAAGEFVVS